MDWFFIIAGGLLALFLVIVLGKYSLTGEIEKGEDRVSYLLNVQSRCRLLGIEWIQSTACNRFHLILFGRKIRGFRMKTDPSRRTLRSRPGSGSMRFRPSAESIRRLLFRIIRLVRRFGLDGMSVSGTAGLGDPATTGMAFGMLQSFRFTIPEKVVLDVEPDFARRCFEGKGTVQMHFCLITVLVFLFRLGWDCLRIRKSSNPGRIRTDFA